MASLFRAPDASRSGAKSRQQLVEEARAERATRQLEKERDAAACTVQRHWRGHTARRANVSRVCDDIAREFTSLAADPVARPDAVHLCSRAVCPLLAVTSPPASHTVDVPRASLATWQRAAQATLALTLRALAPHDSLSGALSPHNWARLARLCAQISREDSRLVAGKPLLAAAAARCLVRLLPAAGAAHPLASPHRAATVRALASTDAVYAAADAAMRGGAANAAAAYPYSHAAAAPPGARALPSALAAARCLLATCPQDAADRCAVGLLSHVFANQGFLPAYDAVRVACLAHDPAPLISTLLDALAAGTQLAAEAELRALAALTALLAGPAQERHAASGHGALALPRSELLAHASLRTRYLAASAAVTQRAAAARLSADAAGWPTLAAAAWPLTQSANLLDLLAGARDSVPCGVGGEACGMSALIATYASWLQIAGAAAPRLPPDALRRPLVNVLAFSGAFMAALWRAAAAACGMPLAVPPEATAGLDIPSLAGGIAAFDARQLQALGLFCELYAHLLSVLDDAALYERGDPLPLATTRAVALSLNALVFASHMARAGKSRLGPTAAAALAHAAPALQALQARHVRRALCPEAAWLAPWHAASARDPELRQGSALMGNALSILLVRAAASDDGDDNGAPRPPPLAPGAAGAVVDLLQVAPHTVPYELRVEMFRALLALDKSSGAAAWGAAPRCVRVRRGSVEADARAALLPLGAAVKAPIAVVYIDAHGIEEPGIDQGGLLKDLLEEVLHGGFDPARGLVRVTAANEVLPDPAAARAPGGLEMLQFLGLIVGKALYEGLLLDVELAPLCALALLRRPPAFEDLAAVDAALYQSLLQVKNYDGDATDLALDFVVADAATGREHALLPAGAALAVTDANKLLYVHLAAHWHLSRFCGAAAAAFARGVGTVVPAAFLRMFSPREVNELLGGRAAPGGIDAADLRAHTRLSGFRAGSVTVATFWRVFEGLSAEERRSVLKFVTGTRRAPLGGFRHLAPPFTLAKVECGASVFARVGGADVARLPSASTCFNTLKLPNYRRAGTMRAKLLYAVNAKAGFDLS